MTYLDERIGPTAAELGDSDDLLRELRQLHRTRHETVMHGSESARTHHTRRTGAMEQEYLRRNPRREVDEERLQAGRQDS
jgi:hypothetical protein